MHTGDDVAMEIIDRLTVNRLRGVEPAATIELLQGDLSAIPPEHAVDVLVVSAFPDSYTPNPGTLFEDLLARGLDMAEAARWKEEDERSRLGCWISSALPADLARKFNFSRIVCFEPLYPEFLEHSGFNGNNIEETAGFVFRCLNNFAIPDENGRRFKFSRVAMPLLATGNQRVPVEAMLPRLLEAAIFWLEQGLPIQLIKIVAFSPKDAAEAKGIFASMRARRPEASSERACFTAGDTAGPRCGWEKELADTIAGQVIETCKQRLRDDLRRVAESDERAIVDALFDRLERESRSNAGDASVDGPPAPEYDVFISYAHKQDGEVRTFVEELQRLHPERSIFYDRRTIPVGGQWIKMISDAVQKAATFVAVLSPDYTASPVCWDEFQCAKLKEYNSRTSVIKTVRLYSEPSLPPIMGIYSYGDCAEGDLMKLRACAATLLS